MTLTPPEKRIFRFIVLAIVIVLCFLIGVFIIKILFSTPSHQAIAPTPSPTPTEEVLFGSGNPSEKQAFPGIKRFEKSGKGPAEFEFEAGGIVYVTSIYAYGNKNEALPTRVNFLSSETRNAFEAVDVVVTNDTGSDFGPSTDQRAGRMSGTYVVTVDTSEDVTWKIEMFEVSR